MEGLEDTQAKVLELNAKVATIRVLEALGAGDAEYVGFLVVTTEFRIMPRDTLHINFRLENNITDEDWEFVVLKPLNWCLQGEIVGVLKRPRKPIPPDATTAEKTQFRPYQKTKVPFTKARANSLEEARAYLEGSTPVRCLVTYQASDKSKSRIILGLNAVVHGSRPVQTRKRGAPAREVFNSIKELGWIFAHARRSHSR